IDEAELERVVSYTPSPPPIITPSVRVIDDVTVTRYPPPGTDFALTRYVLPPHPNLPITPLPPHLALRTALHRSLISGSVSIELSPGAGIFAPGHGGSLDLAATDTAVTVFIASQS